MTSTGAVPRSLTLPVGVEAVSALLLVPQAPRAIYVFGHGAGAGMTHPFMASMAERLSGAGIASLRYNFPYMEDGRGRPDRRSVLLRTVRTATEAATAALPGVPLIAGGKSMGGRMTSLAQAESPLPGVAGLAFLGFPLHEAKKPGIERAAHLSEIAIPMLFLQGTRDALADLDLLRGVTDGLGSRITLHVVEGADHGFHVLKRSGRTDEEVLDELATSLSGWIDEVPPLRETLLTRS